MSNPSIDCDCPEDKSGIFPPGIKNHTHDCPTIAWFSEVGKSVDPDEFFPPTPGFIATPTFSDIEAIRETLNEIRNRLEVIEAMLDL